MRTWRICVRCDVDSDSGGDSLLRVQVDDAEATGHHSCHFRRCCIPFDGDRHCVLDCEIGGKHVEQVKLLLYASSIVLAVFLETNNELFLRCDRRSARRSSRCCFFRRSRSCLDNRFFPPKFSWLCFLALLGFSSLFGSLLLFALGLSASSSGTSMPCFRSQSTPSFRSRSSFFSFSTFKKLSFISSIVTILFPPAIFIELIVE